MPHSHSTLESPSRSATRGPSGRAVAGLLAGILLFMLGLGLLGTEIHRIGWRVKARFWCQQGRARIEKTEILFREGAYELETTFHLEWDGKVGKSTARLDPDDSSTPTRQESEARAQRVPAGSLQPCWYWPPDPENNNILAPDGLRLGAAWGRLWIPALVLLIGWELSRWSRRRLKHLDSFSEPS